MGCETCFIAKRKRIVKNWVYIRYDPSGHSRGDTFPAPGETLYLHRGKHLSQ